MHIVVPNSICVQDGSKGRVVVHYVLEIDGHLHCSLRYSELRSFYNDLSKVVKAKKCGRSLSSFPSRAIVATNKSALKQRQLGLEHFMQATAKLEDNQLKLLFTNFLIRAQIHEFKRQTLNGPRPKSDQSGVCGAQEKSGVNDVIHLSLFNEDKLLRLQARKEDNPAVIYTWNTDVVLQRECWDSLQKACEQVGVAKTLISHFGLFLCTQSSSSSWSMTKHLMGYECPFITANIHKGRILLRKICWDPRLDDLLCVDSPSFDLMMNQSLEDLQFFFNLSLSKEQRATIDNLKLLRSSPTSFLRLARKELGNFFSFVAYKPCIANYPHENTRAEVRLGRQQLILRHALINADPREGQDDCIFEVTRMRSWRVMSGHADSGFSDEVNSEGPEKVDHSIKGQLPHVLELSFEYLMDDNVLTWITLRTEDAILLSNALQGMVEELLMFQKDDPETQGATFDQTRLKGESYVDAEVEREAEKKRNNAIPSDICDYSVGDLNRRFESISYISTRASAEALFDNLSLQCHQRQ